MKLFSAVKRVGTHPHKFQFTLTVAAIEFSKPIGEILSATLGKEAPTDINRSSVSYVWKRGPRSASCGPQPIPKADSNVIAQWGSPQTLMCTLYQDSKNGDYLSKGSEITFKVGPSGNDLSKVLGIAKLDLAKYAGKENIFEDVVELSKCKDKNAKVKFSVQAKWLKEVSAEEDSPSVAEHEEDASLSDDEKTESTNKNEPKQDPTPAVTAEASPLEHAADSSKRNSVPKPDHEHAKISIILAERDDLLKQNQKLEKALNAAKLKLQKKEEEGTAFALTKQERDIAVTKVNKLSEEVKHIHAQLAEGEAKHKEAHEISQKEIKALTMKQSTLSEEKSSALAQVEKLQSLLEQEKKDHQSQADDLKKQLQDLKTKLSKKEEELGSLNSLKQERDIAVSKASKLQDELKQVTATLKDNSSDSDTWKKKYEEVSHKLQAAEDKMHKVLAEAGAEKQKSEQKIQDYEAEISKLHTRVTSKEEESTKLNQIQQELESKILDLQKKLQEVSDESAAHTQGLTNLRLQLEEAESSRDSFKEKLKKASMDKDEADEEILKLKSTLQHLQQENSTLREDIQKMKDEEEEAKEELSKAEAELKRVKQRLLDIDAESSSFTEKISASERKLFEATQKLSQMQLERSEFDEIRQKLEDKKAAAEKKRDAAVKELERLQGIVGDMEVKLVNTKIELVNTVDRLGGLEVENNHMKEQIAALGKATAKKR